LRIPLKSPMSGSDARNYQYRSLYTFGRVLQ
jgi:hypothetical protein